MATSAKAFQQVKEILRKLDQSIDTARSRRLGLETTGEMGTGTPATTATPATPPALGQPTSTNGNGHPQARPLNRAKPLNRDD